MKYAVKTIYTMPAGKDVYESWPIRERIKYLTDQRIIVYNHSERTWDETTATRTTSVTYSSKDAYNEWISFLKDSGEQDKIDQHNSDNNITAVEKHWTV